MCKQHALDNHGCPSEARLLSAPMGYAGKLLSESFLHNSLPQALQQVSKCHALQGNVTVQFSSPSIPSEAGPRILVQAAPVTYRKQVASIPVITTASEYM